MIEVQVLLIFRKWIAARIAATENRTQWQFGRVFQKRFHAFGHPGDGRCAEHAENGQRHAERFAHSFDQLHRENRMPPESEEVVVRVNAFDPE